MTTRRARGDGGLHWDESRQRWIATTTVGYDGRGKRMVRKASGRTKTEAKTKLRDLLALVEEGVTTGRAGTPWPRPSRTGWRTGWPSSRRQR